jgi:5,10-methylenetetrahydromethanopterin reductase
MRIGVMLGPRGPSTTAIDQYVQDVRELEAAGFASAWFSNASQVDQLTALAVVGHQVPRIELGTAVVPTYPRHPMALAQQALTAQAAVGGRLTLGIGPSHQVSMEGAYGYSFDKPLRHVREYLDVLQPLLRGEPVDYRGATVTARGQQAVLGASEVPILVAALGPRMLELAGRRTQGTVTWLAGIRTVRTHIVPRLVAAAEAAGRPAPRVVIGLPIGITDDAEATRRRLNEGMGRYGTLPSYRAMLDIEGVADPGDVAVLGDEASVRAQLAEFADAGTTDFMASLVGSREQREKTLALLAALNTAPAAA